MRAVLEFTLPEDEHEFRVAADAMPVRCALLEFGEYLRAQYKYVSPSERDDIVAIRAKWFEIMGDVLDE